jgi:ATP-binding cassette subfamily F protein 3
MLQFQEVRKGYGTGEVLESATFQVQPGDRVGLVGRNGSGKSTILRLISGEEQLDKGEIIMPNRWRVGSVRQHPEPETPEQSLVDFAASGSQELQRLGKRLADLEARLAKDGENTTILQAFGEAQSAFEAGGGYERRHRAEQALSGLGFAESAFSRPFLEFSGGWRMRAELARVLLADPDLLLLDEPTNYLDLPAIEWLRENLGGYQGTFLLVSHDRLLLNELTKITLAVEAGQVTRYVGNYDEYRRLRAEALERNAAAIARQDKKIAEIEAFAERFGAKNTKATQAKSRLKEIDRMEKISAMAVDGDLQLRLNFPDPERSGDRVIRLTGLAAQYGDGPRLFDGVDLTLERGMRAAIVGANGLGKTTLLRLMAGALTPAAGEVELGAKVSVGYLPQQYSELLDPSLTLMETARRKTPEKADGEIRTALGAYGFTGDDVDKTVSNLSGGEKIRLSLYLVSRDTPNLLLLDEPTTHLDIASCEALQEAIAAFAGTVCVVSHDVAFLQAVANRIVEVTPGQVSLFYGGYEYYRSKRNEPGGRGQPTEVRNEGPDLSGTESGGSKKAARREAAQRRQELAKLTKPLKARIAKAEERMEALDAEEAEIVSGFEDSSLTGEQLSEANKRLAAISAERDTLTEDWEGAMMELEEIESDS